ncbi:thioredoxin family protein [Ampullimonas aquatilis]|uniref:thioredoxin family protein n=1 Tax=Ampullimonas aquatilis TaxID=1341549 RepID=UPI003C7406C4
MTASNSFPIMLFTSFLRRLVPLAGAAALMVALPAQALQIMPYSAAALASAEKTGQSYALHFHASWCPTCRAQEKVLQNLQSDAELDKVSVLVVDYDKEHDLKLARKVRAQSTLIVYHGTAEKARLAGDTDPANIKTALKAGLQ